MNLSKRRRIALRRRNIRGIKKYSDSFKAFKDRPFRRWLMAIKTNHQRIAAFMRRFFHGCRIWEKVGKKYE